MSQRLVVMAMLGVAFLFLGAVWVLPPSAAADAGEPTAPTIRILAGTRTTFEGTPFVSFSCEAANPNKAPLMFVGYRPDSFDPPLREGQISPLYIVQLQRDSKWQKHPVGWCGTGIDGITLPAGSTKTFGFAVPADPTWKALRVGIRWSPPLEFSTAKPDAFKAAWSEAFTQE